MDIHVNYEQVEAYMLKEIEDKAVLYPETRRVARMKLTPDRSAIVLNHGLTLAGLPQSCFQHRLGNRSALEWIIDQYRVTTDTNGEMISEPNRLDDPEYIVKLVKKVVTVSIQTVELGEELAPAVTQVTSARMSATSAVPATGWPALVPGRLPTPHRVACTSAARAHDEKASVSE
jgi:hypothetical protein